MTQPQEHPVVLFRTVAEGLPALPDFTLQQGTFCLITDATPPSLSILQSPGGVQAWDTIGGAGTPGVTDVIQYDIGFVTGDSAASIPAGAIVLYRGVEVTAAYDGGATIDVGSAATPALLLATPGDIDPATPDLYDALDPTAWGGVTGPVRTTVGGAPTMGAATVTVVYGIPLA